MKRPRKLLYNSIAAFVCLSLGGCGVVSTAAAVGAAAVSVAGTAISTTAAVTSAVVTTGVAVGSAVVGAATSAPSPAASDLVIKHKEPTQAPSSP